MLREYRHYRMVNTKLHSLITAEYLDQATLEKAARLLKLTRNREIVLGGDDDANALLDCAIYEVRQADGKTCVERYAEEVSSVSPSERRVLAAMCRARTGLFRVDGISKRQGQIMLENLIMPGEKEILTDIAFSQTIYEGLLLFFRAIRVEAVTMTSGVAFVFPQRMEAKLLEEWERLEGKSPELFAWFFRESKRSGYETHYL